MNFKSKHLFNDRKMEAERILLKYPDRIPIICEKINIKNSQIPNIDKNKYLVPTDLSLGQFIHIIRSRIKMNSEQAIYIFVDNSIIPSSSEIIKTLYDKYKDLDGFMYLSYSGENTFG